MSKDGFKCGYCGSDLAPPRADDGRFAKTYCNKRCYREAKRIRERGKRTYARNIKRVREAWSRRYPKSIVFPGWPHRFNEEMKCDFCGTTWNQNQVEDQPICTNPVASLVDVNLNRYGRPAIVRNKPAKK